MHQEKENDVMHLKGLVDEDFTQYKEPSMFLIFSKCSFKCCSDAGVDVCQNSKLAQADVIEVSKDIICRRYLDNTITKAVVCGGLEPFDTPIDLISFIHCLRVDYECNDTIVIYTGYYPNEIENILRDVKKYDNIIVKFGRFIPNENEYFNDVLGVNLSSSNQFAVKIS